MNMGLHIMDAISVSDGSRYFLTKTSPKLSAIAKLVPVLSVNIETDLQVKVLSTVQLCELSFHKTRHLRNPYNENLPVKVLFFFLLLYLFFLFNLIYLFLGIVVIDKQRLSRARAINW